MVEIIEHSNYEAPVDNENVAWLRFYHQDTDGKGYAKKAFRVCDGIWIVPEVLNKKSEDPRVTDPHNFSCYNPEYLSTYDERSDYLKKMTIIFKRLASNPLGGNLLQYLKYSSPVLGDKSSKRYIEKLEKSNGKTIHTTEEVNCIVIIHGSYNLDNITTFSLYKDNPNTIKFGINSFITFCPDVIDPFARLLSDDLFFLDPATTLFHELTHVFHTAHFIKYDKKFLKQVGTNAEELITFGGIDLEISKAEIEGLRVGVLDQRKQIIDSINKSIKEGGLSSENIQYLAVKYNLQRDATGKLFTNAKLDQKYLYTLIDHFTEVNFSDAFNLPKRVFYRVTSIPLLASIDVSNPKEYTIEKGLAKNLLKRDKGEEIVVHKDLYFPKEWYSKMMSFSRPNEEWIYLDKNFPELSAAIQKKESIVNPMALPGMKYRDDLGITVVIPRECAPSGFKVKN